MSRIGRTVLGLALAAVGVLLALANFVEIDLSQLWPLFVVVPGVALLAVGISSSGGLDGAATVAGAVVTSVGLLLAYQNITGHWESWSYAWALAGPGAVGAGRYLHGTTADHPEMRSEGLRLMSVGVVLFVVGLVFFEGMVGVSGRELGVLGDILLPALLIGAGLWLIFRPGRGESSPEEP